MCTAEQFRPKGEQMVAAITLKDLQTKFYNWWWPVGPKRIMYLNIRNKKEKPIKVVCGRIKYTNSKISYENVE
jgi:hypothetical protein